MPGRRPQVLKGINLRVGSGEVHVVMGPNGSGKSTLAHALMGRPGTTVTSGRVQHRRDRPARPGPVAAGAGRSVPGAATADRGPRRPARGDVGRGHGAVDGGRWPDRDRLERMEDRPDLLRDGPDAMATTPSSRAPCASGCWPRRPPSGSTAASSTDRSTSTSRAASASATRWSNWASCTRRFASWTRSTRVSTWTRWHAVASRLEAATRDWGLGVLVVTHFQRLLVELRADRVHVLVDGRIAASGGPELAHELERTGYGAYGTG